MSNFKFFNTNIQGVVIVEPAVYGDSRGFFMETFSEKEYALAGISGRFVQDNHSRSSRGVLRGMHFQRTNPQGKLIRVASGAVLDVVVDMRSESPTYGEYVSAVLSAENRRQLYVPPRFAHGFLTLEDGTDFMYKCTEYYHPESDGGILWNDTAIGIDWQLSQFGLSAEDLVLSEKDKHQPVLAEIDPTTLFKSVTL